MHNVIYLANSALAELDPTSKKERRDNMKYYYKTWNGLRNALEKFDKRGLLNSWYYDEETHRYVINVSEPR